MEFVFAIVYLFVFSFGAAIGSFLNVVVYRLPARIPLHYPPSRCPKCNHRLGKTENIPIFGWLWLKGSCRWCKSRISCRYPVVEAITGLLFFSVFYQFGWGWLTVGYWGLLSWLLALSLIDLDTMTLPNCLTQSGLLLGLGFQAIWGWQSSLAGMATALMYAIAAACLGVWLLNIITMFGTILLGQEAMGAGDAKLLGMIGAWLGWKVVLMSCLLACIIGAVVGGGAIALGWIDRKQPVPFGPCLAASAAIMVFWGQQLISLYTSLFFPLNH